MLKGGHRQPLQAFQYSHKGPKCRPSARIARLIVRADAASSSKPQLVVVGSLNADTVLEVDRIPEGGETMNAKTLSTFPGGKVGPCHCIQAHLLLCPTLLDYPAADIQAGKYSACLNMLTLTHLCHVYREQIRLQLLANWAIRLLCLDR